jgi:hypothetical protein
MTGNDIYQETMPPNTRKHGTPDIFSVKIDDVPREQFGQCMNRLLVIPPEIRALMDRAVINPK